MSENSRMLEGNQQLPPSITAEEFDAKFDAGEDVSEYFDWNTAVMVQPGELSPGQKLSMIQEMIDDLLRTVDGPKYFAALNSHLDIPLSTITLIGLGRAAAQHGVNREQLVRSWIEEKLDERKAAK